MRKVVKTVKSNIYLWICPAVYVWGLALQANISSADDPLFARILDSAAVLLTLVIWATTLGIVVILLAGLVRESAAARISRFFCEATIFGATLYYFQRWLSKWSLLPPYGVVTVTAVIGCVGVAAWVLIRRQRGKKSAPDMPVMMRDCFQFGAIPLILGAAFLIGIQMVTHLARGYGAATQKTERSTSKDSQPRPNVIVIVMDGLRAGNMSLYGYNRKTTPYLEQTAQHSHVYLQAYSNTTMTRTSMTTLLTGRHPFSHGRLSPVQHFEESRENLLRVLMENGYTTAAVSSHWQASAYSLGFSQSLSGPEIPNFYMPSLHSLQTVGVRSTITGERIYNDLAGVWTSLGFPKKEGQYGSADNTLGRAWDLSNSLEHPFFLYVHVFEPHAPAPYNVPSPFAGRYSTVDTKDLRNSQVGRYYSSAEQAVVDAYEQKYDECILFLDYELGKFLQNVNKASWGAHTLIILTADHGDSLERGYFGHGEVLYDSSVHVPLIIRWPGQQSGKRIQGLVQSTDIAPTVLQAVGLPVPAWMDGSPLGSEGQVKSSDVVAINYRHPVDNKFFLSPTKLAIWWMSYKAIFDCETKTAEFYDLNTDPLETTDLSSSKPFELAALRSRLEAHLQKGAGRSLASCPNNFNS